MRIMFLLMICLLTAVPASADPGVGIVMDKYGNLFYTDLSQVWMIQPDGTKKIAVPGVHSHELYIDSTGALYGEHLWYNGEQLNTWGHYLWRRDPDGTISRIRDSTAGFPEWVSFVRDAAGSSYHKEPGIPTRFWKITAAGDKAELGQASLQDIGRLHVNSKGILFFSNKRDIYCIPPGEEMELYAANVAADTTTGKDQPLSHAIMHIWSHQKYLYVATGNLIRQIDHRRLVTTIYQSAPGWFPASGLVSPAGDFWVLEYNNRNEVRVNRITNNQRKEMVQSNWFQGYGAALLLTVAVVVGLIFLFKPKPAR